VHWQVLVIDDDSEDNTLEIAGAIPGVTVLRAPKLEKRQHGFTGKNNALWFGANHAYAHASKWLLFTDADTLHEPNSLHHAITEAERHSLALLSYSAKQLTTGLLQRALMPLIFSELASTYPPKKIADPKSPVAAANGQYLLVNREVYFEMGGHQAVADRVLEDVALARLVKRRYAIKLRYAGEAVSTRMYRSTEAFIEGWTKNLAILFGNPLLLAANRLLDFFLLLGLPVLLFAWPHLVSWQMVAIVLLWLRVLLRYYNRISRSNFPLVDCGLSVFVLPLFSLLLVRSWQKVTIQKEVTWKGREYRT